MNETCLVRSAVIDTTEQEIGIENKNGKETVDVFSSKMNLQDWTSSCCQLSLFLSNYNTNENEKRQFRHW